MTRVVKCGLLVLVLITLTTLSHASATVICVQDPASGCVAAIPTSAPLIYLASDGELPFDPFGFGADTSDGISLNASWLPNLAYPGMSIPGFWTQCLTCVDVNGVLNPFTWVLPAVTPCGAENEPGCEPWGAWYFPGATWNPGTPNYLVMAEADGSWSDVILVNNFGPGGSAQIIFSSDPNVIPEPGTLIMLGTGVLVGFGALRRRLSV